MIDQTLSVDNQVYLIYCEIGNRKHCIQTCTSPKIFYKNYDELLDFFRQLTEWESSYPFHDPLPHKELQYYKMSVSEFEQKFIYRSWESCLNRASTRKTTSARLKVIQQYFSEMEQFRSRFTSEAASVFDGLKTEPINLVTIKSREPPPPPFDFDRERFLKSSVEDCRTAMELYYAFLQLLLFYYRYRNLDDQYIEFCIKLCRVDIALLPKVDLEFREGYGRPFIANLPAFDKLYAIYYRKKDYLAALRISQEHLCCPQRGNDRESTAKIQRRIDLCQKKLSGK